MDGLDSKTLSKLPELDDAIMPAADDNILDLEKFVDLMGEVKEPDETPAAPVTAVVKPVSSVLPTVAVVKASAKVTPIIITEIKPAVVNTTPKPSSRDKVSPPVSDFSPFIKIPCPLTQLHPLPISSYFNT